MAVFTLPVVCYFIQSPRRTLEKLGNTNSEKGNRSSEIAKARADNRLGNTRRFGNLDTEYDIDFRTPSLRPRPLTFNFERSPLRGEVRASSTSGQPVFLFRYSPLEANNWFSRATGESEIVEESAEHRIGRLRRAVANILARD